VFAFAAHSSGSTSKDQLARREVTSIISTTAAGWPGNSEAAGKVLGGRAMEQVSVITQATGELEFMHFWDFVHQHWTKWRGRYMSLCQLPAGELFL
jgi:hypothetical protein